MALLRNYMALLWNYMALLRNYMALLRNYMARLPGQWYDGAQVWALKNCDLLSDLLVCLFVRGGGRGPTVLPGRVVGGGGVCVGGCVLCGWGGGGGGGGGWGGGGGGGADSYTYSKYISVYMYAYE